MEQGYGVSAAQVAQWNKVTPHARFKPGELISVFLPAGRVAAAQTPRTAAPRTAKPATATRKTASKPTRVRVAKD
jgi:membrane-bound lytic murein transglycosylase D